MATRGMRRGRGWPNLNNRAVVGSVRKPGVGHNTSPTTSLVGMVSKPGLPSDFDFPTYSNSSTCPRRYARVVSAIDRLNNDDDVVQMNQKLKIINAYWKLDCQTKNQVEDSFNYIYERCLADEDFSMKVMTMVASTTNSKLEVSGQKIRSLVMRHIQDSYENSKDLRTSNPSGFRSAVRILGEFFHKARLSTGEQISFLVSPLVCYLKLLLENPEPADTELFASQLFLNGPKIQTESPQQLDDILDIARRSIMCNAQLPEKSRLYLLLAIDLVHNKFESLPREIYECYEDEMGREAMEKFRRPKCAAA